MLLKLIAAENVTFSHCVPTILQMILTSPAVKQFDLSRWKVIIGGAKLSKGQAKTAKDMGITRIYRVRHVGNLPADQPLRTPKTYGGLDEDRLLDIVIKTGLPLPLVEVETVDANGEPFPMTACPRVKWCSGPPG